MVAPTALCGDAVRGTDGFIILPALVFLLLLLSLIIYFIRVLFDLIFGILPPYANDP